MTLSRILLLLSALLLLTVLLDTVTCSAPSSPSSNPSGSTSSGLRGHRSRANRNRTHANRKPFSNSSRVVGSNGRTVFTTSTTTTTTTTMAPTKVISSIASSGSSSAASATLKSGRGRNQHRERVHDKQGDLIHDSLSMWIDRQQVKMFSGFSMDIHVIAAARVLPYILDPNFEKYLPIIPSEVGYVNFTWKSGKKKYNYNFDRLLSYNEDVLQAPVVSVDRQGTIPKMPKVFSVLLPCSGNASGIASFSIGLLIDHRGKPLPGFPLRLRLRKECSERVNQNDPGLRLGPAAPMVPSLHASASVWHPVHDRSASSAIRPRTPSFGSHNGPDPECDKKCANGGWCNHDKICQCPEGYMGQYCKTALCYPQCMNGGNCTSPGMCSCPPGFQGSHCEGGICKEKCLNGGKCIQKDTCQCQRGFYGLRCEFTKCVKPCMNGGRCRGVNKCRCPNGYRGNHCELKPLGKVQKPVCKRRCRHGKCPTAMLQRCRCHQGWQGKVCLRQRHNETEPRPPPKKQQIWV